MRPVRSRWLLGTALGLPLLAFAYVFSLRASFPEQRQTLHSLQQRVRLNEVVLARRDEFAAEFRLLEKRLEQIRGRLPADAETGPLRRDLEALAGEAEVRVLSLVDEPPGSLKSWREDRLTLEVRGRPGAVLRFAESLDSTKRFLAVRQIELGAEDTELGARFDIRVFSTGLR